MVAKASDPKLSTDANRTVIDKTLDEIERQLHRHANASHHGSLTFTVYIQGGRLSSTMRSMFEETVKI